MALGEGEGGLEDEHERVELQVLRSNGFHTEAVALGQEDHDSKACLGYTVGWRSAF